MATKDVSVPASGGHHPAAVGTKGHRRRPSGQPPPLPRNLGASGRFWFGVAILGPWTGFSMPSRPLAGLAVSIVGALYALLPHGRPRDLGKAGAAGVLALVIVARMVLAVEGPSAAVFGAILGVAIGLVA